MYIILLKMNILKIKKLINTFFIIIAIISIIYLFFTRDGSIKLGLLLSGYNPFISYENIDYENSNSYLNQIEVDNKIIYLECKTYGIIKLASYYDFNN